MRTSRSGLYISLVTINKTHCCKHGKIFFRTEIHRYQVIQVKLSHHPFQSEIYTFTTV